MSKELKELVSKMTLEEKAGLCSGLNFWETKPVERLGIPKIMMTDGPHGLRKVATGPSTGDRPSREATCYPPAVLSACSFDRDLLKELGAAIGDEAEVENVRIVLGPGVNIKRSPLCGRNFEYFSEDPYLAGEMASSFIDGVQSKGIGTSLKHYAANNQETRRWSSDSQIDERTLREIYLPAFRKAVEESQPATVMCAYNRLNGEYASESARLLTEILRNEWGFEGIVVSDWGAVNERVKGLIAGLELEMPGVAEPSNDEYIAAAVRSGEMKEEVLDLAVERILRIVFKYGGDDAKTVPVKEIDVNAHDALSRKIAAESMVLLKNDKNILPLDKKAKIAFIGEMAEKPRYQGAGSSQVNPFMVTTVLDAAKEYTDVTYAQGYNTADCDEINETLHAQAVKTASAADVCVIFAGLPHHYEAEGYDRTHMRMPEGQNQLIKAVAAANPKTVVVLHNGSPVEMPWSGDVPCILEAYLGGQASGGAIADILFGKTNPCGKLAETLPIKLSDNPSYLYYFGERDVTEYREGIFVGYRYYDTKEMEVRFPFGHGLSYTTFEYSNIKLSSTDIKDTDTLTVTADIKNTGKVAGKEIVQLYVGPKEKDDRLIQADKQLRDFTKISLQPGETKQVTFKLGKAAFSYYNVQISDWHVQTDTYVIKLARSSRDIAQTADVKVTSTVDVPYRATANTTFRDIRRMKRGNDFLKEVAEKFPAYHNINDEPDENNSNYGHLRCVPEFVPRQLRLMGTMQGTTTDDIQKWMDEKLNG
ncbi:MAG: glycoside hydrolase family 3 C-terminal domain-containing protein [Oscillospiraceae bacterium]|nr:glycoside hydrolase family 3 C-terminal domain-containing protein [Oscillospiraceae bacterium]